MRKKKVVQLAGGTFPAIMKHISQGRLSYSLLLLMFKLIAPIDPGQESPVTPFLKHILDPLL